MTGRDLMLLDVLSHHQVLTTDQIARIAYPTHDRAQQRLRQLAARGILDRFRIGIRPGSQGWRYTLGPLGAAILAAQNGKPAPRPAAHADKILRLARSPRMEHLLGVNEFFVALIHHARTHPEQRSALRWWVSEAAATGLCAGLARPDGAGTWAQHPHSRYPSEKPSSERKLVREIGFFLEYDTGTEALQRLIDKLAGYQEARYGNGPDCPVLFWLPSARREANLHRLLAAHPLLVPVATASAEAARGRTQPRRPHLAHPWQGRTQAPD